MKALVIGAGGQLGRALQRLTLKNKRKDEFLFWFRSDFDLTNPTHLAKINKDNVHIVINCAAYTAVDKAEEERKLAFDVNAASLKRMGTHLARLGIPIIHISSDYVYHNYLRRPLKESDPCRPKGYYARTKWRGEKMLCEVHPSPLIFRVSWLYGLDGNNFPKTMLRLGRERSEIRVVNDQRGAPTYANDLASAIIKITDRYRTPDLWAQKAGIYNFCNEGETNWSEIAAQIMRKAKLDCKILPIPSSEYPTPAPRPRYSVLDLAKFQRNFEIPTLPWRERLDKCLDQLVNEST